ncbi:ferrochelatase [Candidatus Marinamargulisbacteria bacterium SCGC AG-414-C22]|nr:ferrochelatase [Candidatus Marinamargulisbacteria bacterium SCGC AG-414-C22]
MLLVNLGSPDSTKVSDVRRYLAEFLMDRYVIDVPFLIRLMIVYCFILPFRPKKSAEAYESIWWEEGSPLIVISKKLQALVQKKRSEPVGLAMRYANPSIKDGIQELITNNPQLKTITLFPLYPHFAMATTLTVIEKTKEVVNKHFPELTVNYIESYYKHSSYINALAASINKALKAANQPHLLFSFHGVPERHVKKTDPTKKHCMITNNCCYSECKEAQALCYSHQVIQTALHVVDKLKLSRDQYTIAFQSRLGNDPWLSPATDDTIERLAKEGVKDLAVVCPAFVSDCLETLEEIGEEGQEIFEKHGGKNYTLIPCLNEDPAWVDTICELIDDTQSHKSCV